MNLRKSMICFISVLTFLMASQTLSVNAATNQDIPSIKAAYAKLSKNTYDAHNLYQKKPKLKKEFFAGKLSTAYVNDQFAYLNFYRSLFDLKPVKISAASQSNAQKTAAIMALINANPLINQHGLPYEKKPAYINNSLWSLAKKTSAQANLHFSSYEQTADSAMTSLLTDEYNLTGDDTGHRAWLLSTRLTSSGIGAAYGNNHYCYFVQKVINSGDTFKKAERKLVSYPSSGVFPQELVANKNIAWSLYLSDQEVTGKPKITITDLDTNLTYPATKVNNYSSSGYGNFKTVISYFPGKTPLVSGHHYQVKIANLLNYKFELFTLKN